MFNLSRWTMVFALMALGVHRTSNAAEPVGQDKAFAALERRIDVDFRNSPLREAADTLERQLGVRIVLDRRGLEANGLNANTPVSFRCQGFLAKSVLRHALRPLDLEFGVREDVIYVSGADELTSPTITYEIGDLVTPVAVGAAQAPNRGSAESLKALVIDALFPDAWEEKQESIQVKQSAGKSLLIVHARLAEHDQIADLLRKLRAARKQP